MLVLDRKPDEGFWIGEHIFVKVLDVRPQRVKLGIKAASDLDVAREELGSPTSAKTPDQPGGPKRRKDDSAHRRRLREALHRSEAENRALLDAIPDMMFRISGEGRFLDFIPAKGQEPAVPPAQFLGKTLQEVFPADFALGAMAYIRRALQTGDTQISEFRLPVPLPSGDVRDYEARIVATGRDEVLVIARDITERKRAEEALRRSQEELAIRNKIAQIFLTTPDEEMYGGVLRVVLEALQSKHGVFGYIDEEGAIVYPSITRDIWDQCQIPEKDIVFPRETWGGIWGRALRRKETLYSNEHFRVPDGHIPVHRSIAAPIIHQDEVIGLLQVGNRPTDYDDRDRELLQTIAGSIAPILSARLERDRQERDRQQAEDMLRVERDLAVALSAAADLDETLRLCLEAAIRVSGLDCGCVYLADRPSGAFELACHQGLGEEFLGSVTRYEAHSDSARYVMTGRPLYTRHQEMGLPIDEPRRREGLRAIAVVPVQHEGAVIAGLCVASHSLDEVPPAARSALETVAAQVGSAIARSRVQEALRESERRFRDVLDVSRDLIYKLNLETGDFEYVSPSVHQVTGFTVEEFSALGMAGVAERFHPDTKARAQAVADSLLDPASETGDAPDLEYHWRVKNGRYRWFRDNRALIRDERGQPLAVVGTASDITERKRTEEAAKDSEAKWRSLVENAPALIVTLDRDGTVQFGNHGVTGAPLKEAIGSSIFKYAPPQYHDDMREVFARVFETGEIGGDFDVPWPEPDGSTSWHSARVGPLKRDGEVVALTIIATDVTERKRAEEALRESEHRFRTLAEATVEGIVVDDSFACLDANPQVAAMVGCELHDFIGKNPLAFVAPESRDLVREHVTSARGEFIEALALRKDGTTFPIEVRGKAAFRQGREVRVTVVRDLTEHKRAEDALRESEQRLRSLVENAPVGLFAIDRQGVITLSEGKAQEALGLKPGEHVGLSISDLYRNVPGIAEGTRRVLSGEAMTATIRVGEVLLEVRTTPVRDHEGRITGAIGVATDITQRDRAEKARRESEERLRTVVANAPVILFAIDSEGVFTVAEGRGMTPVGLRPDEHVGRSVFDVYRNLPGVTDAARRALAGEAFSETVETQNRVFEAHVTPIRGRGGRITGAVAVATDITGRKRAEDELRNREYVLREVQGIAHVGSWDIDLVAGHEALSDEMCAIYGISKDADTRIESIMALVHPDDQKAVRQAFDEAVEGSPPSLEYRIIRPDGEIRTVFTEGARLHHDESGTPIRLIGSTQDITDRKKAEQALLESEQRFRRLADVTLDGIVIHDGAVILDANEQGTAMFGCEPPEFIGEAPLSFVAPESRDVVRQNILSGHEEPYEVTGLRKDGTTFPMEVRGRPASYQGRKVRVGALRDITERRQAEEMIQRAREELEERVERQMERGKTHGLSFRELTVLHLIAAGRADKEIAAELGISPRTASKHVENILEKMGVTSRTEAGVRAVQAGLLGQPN